ncbi:MAG: cell division protein ZapA [Paludibacteraceae bacterium]|nr:cell division protein ZapA [Paludibacteraceae bacterium]
MTPKQNITLRIDCHEIRLTVDRDKEEVYRKAALTLNDTYRKYQQAYPQLPIEKLWVYAALEVAVRLHSDIRAKDLQPVVERLAALNSRIEQTMTQNQDSN